MTKYTTNESIITWRGERPMIKPKIIGENKKTKFYRASMAFFFTNLAMKINEHSQHIAGSSRRTALNKCPQNDFYLFFSKKKKKTHLISFGNTLGAGVLMITDLRYMLFNFLSFNWLFSNRPIQFLALILHLSFINSENLIQFL